MSLLNNVFNYDDIEIVNLNKKYYLVLILIIVIIVMLFLIKKDNYYVNTFSSLDETVLLVESKYLDKIKSSKEIVINDIKYDYSVNIITPVDSSFLVSINLNHKVKNTNHGVYKINIGKERLFDYIVRIIKK